MLEFSQVYKKYRDGPFALSIGELKVPSGEIVGILGANGCGKTTLLKAVMGLGELEEGGILLDGRPVPEQYADVAFITEEGSFPPNMSPKQYGSFLADYFPRFNAERYGQLLDFFELDSLSRMKRLSRGERSKLEICAGFSKGARLILMDEPFNGKDAFARRDFLKLMLASLREDETVLITTHMLDEIENVLDRAIIMRRGAVSFDIYMDELREQGRDLSELMAEAARYKEDRYKQFLPKRED